jgi:hypothetical protein
MPRKPAELPTVHVELPIVVCPHDGCDSETFHMERSTDQGDGSRFCRMACLECGRKFNKVVEFIRQDLEE